MLYYVGRRDTKEDVTSAKQEATTGPAITQLTAFPLPISLPLTLWLSIGAFGSLALSFLFSSLCLFSTGRVVSVYLRYVGM